MRVRAWQAHEESWKGSLPQGGRTQDRPYRFRQTTLRILAYTMSHQNFAEDIHEDELIGNNDEEMQSESQAEDSEGSFASGSEGSSLDTDDEIAQVTKSKKTLKRKRRATEPSRFGATLQFLLDTDAPSTQPLSLKPSVARQRNDEKLELRAKKVLQIEKKEKEDKGRVTDVIGGWGGESERALRKVAQRGGTEFLK